MAKKLKLVDEKMEKVVSVLGQASEQITKWSEDAQTAIQQINAVISQINTDLGAEAITPEDAAMKMEKEVGKLYGKLGNRIKWMTKNTNAMKGLLNAIKAMQDEDEK